MVLITGLNNWSTATDAKVALHEARSDGYDFVTTNLPSSSSMCRSDVIGLESRYWGTSVVGIVTSPDSYRNNMEMDHVDDHWKENIGEELIKSFNGTELDIQQVENKMTYMLDWAAHMNIPAVILPQIPCTEFMNYGRFLASQVLKSSANNVQLWVRVPLDKSCVDAFRIVHKMCDGAANLGCILEFQAFRNTSDQLADPMYLIHELIGCNLRAVSFHTNIFLTNKKGYPTLSKANQFFFIQILKRIGRTCRVLVEGLSDILLEGDAAGTSGCLPHLQYLKHLRSKDEVVSVLDTEEGKMESGYLDHLQSALQPLGDNLEFSTYEVFEKDPVKYKRYREAVELAIEDKIKGGELTDEGSIYDSNSQIMHITIFVVGAGRGPLVNASLDAVANVNQKQQKRNQNASKFIIQPQIFAVEKNECAVLYLQSLKDLEERWKDVTVVECDMRLANRDPLLSYIINGPEKNKADIVVSELLGSFGCNELSPECLDGFQRTGLMKETCISIPQRYTSFIAPVSSMKLHAEVQANSFSPSNSTEGPAGKPSGMMQAMETPYVVRTHLASQTHEEQVCWDFVHPVKRDSVLVQEAAVVVNNQRHAQVTFKGKPHEGFAFGSGYGKKNKTLESLAHLTEEKNMQNGRTVHGFLGTFHCMLYKSRTEESAEISIQPSTFSVGMFSWFPLFFPLREPLFVPSDGSIKCNIWRKSETSDGTGRVWYEWCADVFTKDGEIVTITPVHNPNGRSCIIRL